MQMGKDHGQVSAELSAISKNKAPLIPMTSGACSAAPLRR
jgi:hypothetical protein